jgi:phospholipase/carboxylesterase
MTRPLAALCASILLACSTPRSQPVAPAPLAYVEQVLGGRADDELPMLIALHGLGDSPEAFLELFAGLDLRVRIIAPRAPDPYAVGTSWFPIDDPARAPGAIVDRAASIVRLADHVRKLRPTRGLPLVTGFSQGGMLSFAIAAYHPQHFHAALPIAGTLPPAMPPYHEAPEGFRVTAFHGRADSRIAYAGAEQTLARLHAVGTTATLEGFAGLGHGISPALRQRYVEALERELARLR